MEMVGNSLARADARGHVAVRIVVGNPSAHEICPSHTRGFLSRLDATTTLTLLRRSQDIDLPEDARVSPGDFAILTRGLLRLVQFGSDGRRRIVGITLPGEAILPEEQKDGLVLEAAIDATICVIHPSSRQAALAIGFDLRDQFLRCIRKKQDRARKLAVALATLCPNERLLAFLADCTAYMPWDEMPGGGGVLTMQLTRQDIAALLGTTPETICRALHVFDASGLIRMQDPRRFVIPDVARLCAQVAGHALADPKAPAPFSAGSVAAQAAMTSVNAAGGDAR